MRIAAALLSLLKLDALAGVRTYVAAAGLFGLAVYLLSEGKVNEATQAFFNAMGLLGLREAVKAAGPVVIAPAAVVVAPEPPAAPPAS